MLLSGSAVLHLYSSTSPPTPSVGFALDLDGMDSCLRCIHSSPTQPEWPTPGEAFALSLAETLAPQHPGFKESHKSRRPDSTPAMDKEAVQASSTSCCTHLFTSARDRNAEAGEGGEQTVAAPGVSIQNV